MLWKGENIDTMQDILRAVQSITLKEEATEFMETYLKETLHAKENIGYMAGYLSREEKHRIYDLFEVEHPIFGKRDPTMEEALLAGFKMGRQSRHDSSNS